MTFFIGFLVGATFSIIGKKIMKAQQIRRKKDDKRRAERIDQLKKEMENKSRFDAYDFWLSQIYKEGI